MIQYTDGYSRGPGSSYGEVDGIVTIKEVAKEANVSVATISRTLNNDKNVSEKTRRHVMEVIERLGYTPNVLGRNLRVSKTNRILTLVPDISNTFYSEVLRGIDDLAEKNGYMTMVSTTKGNREIELKYILQLYNKNFDGIILTSSEQSPEELSACSRKAPLVMCCEYKYDTDISTVIVDNRKAEYDAVCALIEKGHRRIALVTNAYSYSAKERTKGYLAALSDHAIPVIEPYIIKGGYEYIHGIEAAARLMDLRERPTAILAISDLLAVAINNYIMSIGLTPGTDIDIFGFDNTIFSSSSVPPINTIAQPAYEIGTTAMELLLKKIKDLSCENEIVIKPHAIIEKNIHPV